MRKLKEPPLALGGLGLSFFSLGNTLGDYSTLLCYILGGITFVLYTRWYNFCFIFTITNGICKIF